MLACQKYELDRPLAQAAAELPHECGFPADAFVNDDPFDAFHDKRRQRFCSQRASGPPAFFHASKPPSMWQAAVRPASCAACTAMAERSPKAQ
jgi:hypothetical protein